MPFQTSGFYLRSAISLIFHSKLHIFDRKLLIFGWNCSFLTKITHFYRKLLIFGWKLLISHSKLLIFDRKLLIFDKKITHFYRKLLIFGWKLLIFDLNLRIFDRKMLIFDWKLLTSIKNDILTPHKRSHNSRFFMKIHEFFFKIDYFRLKSTIALTQYIKNAVSNIQILS